MRLIPQKSLEMKRKQDQTYETDHRLVDNQDDDVTRCECGLLKEEGDMVRPLSHKRALQPIDAEPGRCNATAVVPGSIVTAMVSREIR